MAIAQTTRIQATADAYTGGQQVSARLEADTQRIILQALSEDTGIDINALSQGAGSLLCTQDLTTSCTVPVAAQATAVMLAKTPGVVAGLPIAQRVFELVDSTIKFQPLVDEGTIIDTARTPIAHIAGSARGILLAERTALNLIQRLSGIATVAHRFARQAQPFDIAIVDTRKTTPGLRTLEKYAVKVGGAANHRYGLFDAILIKDNHIKVAGGVKQAIAAARAARPDLPVEVEVTNADEIEAALAAGAEKIMLDNMTPEQIRQSVARIGKSALIEVSGGVNADNLDSYLIPGVNAISIGALTHSVRSMDISLDIEV